MLVLVGFQVSGQTVGLREVLESEESCQKRLNNVRELVILSISFFGLPRCHSNATPSPSEVLALNGKRTMRSRCCKDEPGVTLKQTTKGKSDTT